MKVILYMAITANGMIAKSNREVEWSSEEGESYYSKVKEIGNLITGSVTYPEYEPQNFKDMGDPLVVILTKDKSRKVSEKVNFANSPLQAIKILEDNGFKEALVAGGAKTNASFLKENLIDEIFLDLEPIIYGEGLPLFSPTGEKLNLKLLETKKIGSDTLQLHYEVLKQ